MPKPTPSEVATRILRYMGVPESIEVSGAKEKLIKKPVAPTAKPADSDISSHVRKLHSEGHSPLAIALHLTDRLHKPVSLASVRAHLTAKPLVLSRETPQHVQDDARTYMESRGLKYDPKPSILTVPDDFSTKVAHWYAGAKDVGDIPKVAASYRAYADESLAQLKHLLARGVKITPMKSLSELYPSSDAMRKDAFENRHIKYLPTALGWDGDASHPMAKETGLHTEDGTPILYNDAFRIVHDWFGHGIHGHQFGPKGEARAWHEHARMYSPEARPAMSYETFGQTRDYFFGNQKHLPIDKRNFPRQKASMLPRALTPKVKLSREELRQHPLASAVTARLAEGVKGVRVSEVPVGFRGDSAIEQCGELFLLSNGTKRVLL